jgi:hypothetical protein
MEDRQGAKAQKQRSFNKIDMTYIALKLGIGKRTPYNTLQRHDPAPFFASSTELESVAHASPRRDAAA